MTLHTLGPHRAAARTKWHCRTCGRWWTNLPDASKRSGCGNDPAPVLTAGDRAQVLPDYDETWNLLGLRTQPGTVAQVYIDSVVVRLDGGQAVPYPPHQLKPLPVESPTPAPPKSSE